MSVVLATAGYDHKLRFWEAPSGRCSRILKFSDSQVNRLEISPDKQFIAAAGNPAIRVYEVVGDAAAAAAAAAAAGTNPSSQSQPPQPSQGGGGGTTTTPNPPHPQQAAVLTLEGHAGNVTCIGFQKEGRYLYSSSEDGTIKVWDLRNPHACASFRVGAAVNSVTLRTDKDEFISGDQAGCVKVWDLRLGTTSGSTGSTSSSSSRSGAQSHHHLERGCINSLRPLAGNLPLSPSNADVWSPSIMGASSSNNYHHRSNNNTSKQPQFYSEGAAPIQAVDVSEDSRTLVAISNHGTVFVWDPSSTPAVTPPLHSTKRDMNAANESHATDLNHDSALDHAHSNEDMANATATAESEHPPDETKDDTRGEEDTPTSSALGWLRPITKFRAHAPGTYCLHGKIAPDCRHLVTTSSDGTAKLWDTTTWELTATLMHSHPHSSTTAPQPQPPQQQQHLYPPLHPNRSRSNPTRRVGHSANPSVSFSSPHGASSSSSLSSSWVWDAAFCADSTYLVTASSDQIARLWNLRSGEVVRQYHGHESAVTCVALNDSNVI